MASQCSDVLDCRGICVQCLVGARDFSAIGRVQTVCGTHLPEQWVSWAVSSALKRTGLEADRSPSSSVNVKTSWRLTTFLSPLNGAVFNKTRVIFYLYLYFNLWTLLDVFKVRRHGFVSKLLFALGSLITPRVFDAFRKLAGTNFTLKEAEKRAGRRGRTF